MKLKEIINLLEAEVICGGEDPDMEIRAAFASDFMSDILAMASDEELLITGMLNPQVVRTAEMMDMSCIIFVRGKRPGEDMVRLAQECGMTVLSTQKLMFTSCGILYSSGLGNKDAGHSS